MPERSVSDSPVAGRRAFALVVLKVFLPLLALVCLAVGLYAGHNAEKAVAALAEPELLQVGAADSNAEAYLVRPIRTLRGLAQLQTDVRAALAGGDEGLASLLSQTFVNLMIRNPDFLQLRWIGNDGRERVRVESEPDAQPRVIAADALQDKGDRPYVSETLRLPGGALYVSPLDLNVEQGKVVVPYQPTLRLAMHVFTETGTSRGVIVFNVDGKALLREFARASRGNRHLLLLDAEAFYLRGEDPGREWGFMFGRQDTLARDSPRAWQAMGAADHGQIELPDGLWTWETTRPVPPDVRRTGHPVWKTVSHLPPEALRLARRGAWTQAATGGILLALLAATMAWVVAVVDQRRRLALRKVAEREQERDDLLRFLRSVTDNMPTLVAYWDRELRIRFANRAYAEWFSRSVDEVAGMERSQLLGAGRHVASDPYVAGALAGDPQSFERTFRRPNGVVAHTLNRYIPDRDESGVKGFIVVSTDVTDLKDAQLRLEQANARLELESLHARDASRAKSEFLSNMSHEIRTPMNGILGLCYLLEKEPLPPAAREMMKRMRDAGRSLLGLINDVLDFSKIESGRLETEQVPFRLGDVLDNLAGLLSASVGEKPIELVVGPPPPDGDFLRGDPLRLGQVLINLAGNAVKFTRSGEIVVRVAALPLAAQESPAPRVRLRFSVRDTGIGIDAAQLEAIFQPFSQADSSTTRRFGGTGLGLAISRRLVELMGGTLEVQSTPGVGSEFRFDLDFATSDPATTITPELAHQRVLVADDQATAREVLVESVASLGWHASPVESGRAALAEVLAGTGRYDVVLLDWRMPDLDGLAVTRRLADAGRAEAMPVVIMVTAFDRDQMVAQPGSELVDAILTKPVTPSTLFNAVCQAKGRRAELSGQAPPVPPRRELDGLRILVVDDSDLNRDVASRILADAGARVETAEDGQDALTRLIVARQAFDVVLMDMQMPVMDGYAATRQIRATPELAGLPVIALTAGAFRAQRDQALAAGVDEFVAKPFDVPGLIETVAGVARRGRALVIPDAGGSAVIRQILNTDAAQRGLGSSGHYTGYLERFVRQEAPLVAGLEGADAATLKAAAHRLRGVAGQLGIERVADLAGSIEDSLEAGRAADALVIPLRDAVHEATQAIALHCAARHGTPDGGT